MPIQLQWSAKRSRNGYIHKTQTPFGEIRISQRLYLNHYVWQIGFPDGGIKREDYLNEAKIYAERWVETKLERQATNPSASPTS